MKNLEEMKVEVEAGHHVKPGSEFYMPPNDNDRVSAFIDLIKYRAFASATRALDDQFLHDFNLLSLEQKAVLAGLDKHYLIPAALIEDLAIKGVKQWIGSPITILKEMASAIAISNGDLDSIDKSDKSILYRYFVNSKIESKDAPSFSNGDFLQYTLNRLLSEERVIFTWIIQNLILLVEHAHLDPHRHSEFFIGLFEKSNYIQGELSVLFKSTISKTPTLFETLTNVRLSIDPFTKQTNFSLWLQDSAKFKYIATLRSIAGVVETDQVKKFDKKLELFNAMNKFDRRAL
ncbi:hypothetical protein LMA00_23355 [Burkholderia ambifaria]|uniref:hypothetical protein n=1 Tax=Burkholderia ambifaria TaxID=152480 RepID=UPI001E2B725A|nr:hypothetical protein [Burkholderia ambifaria]UEP49948.1 hypothetical protein LMA00_23355 [Burkholderia ambifaria]